MKSSHPLALRTLSAAAVVSLVALGTQANAQTFVERAGQVGLVHKFESGIDRIGALASMLDWSQQGVAMGDLDGDGDNDVLAVGRLRSNHLWRNDGGSFTDVTAGSNIENANFDNAVALGDYDRDGDLDVFIGAYSHGTGPLVGQNRLLRNEGGLQFTDVTDLAGVRGLGHCLFAKFFDADRDGLLDIGAAEFSLTRNRLWHNNGDGSFTDVSTSSGFDNLGSTHVFGVVDTDGDGQDDVMVGNDWIVSNAAQFNPSLDEFYLHGNGDGSYADLTAGSGLPLNGAPLFLGSSTMGITFGDVDYDGDFDCYKTEVGAQFLMTNKGWPGSGLPWIQEQVFYGVLNSTANSPTGFGQTVGWGCKFGHFDLDPWLDLFKVNGHVSTPNPRNQQNYLFAGDGPTNAFKFTDKTVAYGLNDFFDDRGLSVGDLDQDGDLDLLIAPPAGNLRYFENDLLRAGNGSISVRIQAKTSAPNGEGALVEWTDTQGYLHRYGMDIDGATASQNEKLVLLGVGTETAVTVKVSFPSGLSQTYANLAPGTQLLAIEPELVRLSSRHLPLPKTAGSLVPLVKPTSLFWVTAEAYDANGVPVTNPAQVKINMRGMSALGAVQPLGGNKFRRTFHAPSVAGEYQAVVSFNGFEPKVKPTVNYYGTADALTTKASCSPEAVRALLSEPFSITVAPKDANGILLGKGHSVFAEIPGAIGLTLLSDLGDGRYRGSFSSPSAFGFLPINAAVDGVPLVGIGMLESAIDASGAQSILYTENPNATIALNTNQHKFLFTPRDVFGVRLGSQANVTVTVTPNAGTQPVTVLSGLGDNSQDDGDYYFVLEKPVGSPVNSAKGTYKVFLDGVQVKSQAYSF